MNPSKSVRLRRKRPLRRQPLCSAGGLGTSFDDVRHCGGFCILLLLLSSLLRPLLLLLLRLCLRLLLRPKIKVQGEPIHGPFHADSRSCHHVPVVKWAVRSDLTIRFSLAISGTWTAPAVTGWSARLAPDFELFEEEENISG